MAAAPSRQAQRVANQRHGIRSSADELRLSYSAAMYFSSYAPALDSDTVEASRLDLVPRILCLADGDPVSAARIRGMMWDEYCDSGAPHGRSEEGMMVWWSEQLDTPAH